MARRSLRIGLALLSCLLIWIAPCPAFAAPSSLIAAGNGECRDLAFT